MTIDLCCISRSEKVANAKLHIGIVQCSGAGTQEQEPPGFAYSSAVLPSTFPAAHPLRGTLRELGGAGMHSHRIEPQREGAGREGAGVEDSRVFLVPIHNCKFPSPYLCSPVSCCFTFGLQIR